MALYRGWFYASVILTSLALLSTLLSSPWSQVVPPFKSSNLDIQTSIGGYDSRNVTIVAGFPSLWRDDDSCGPSQPCANAACCGPEGYCGYGEAYCGNGCVSNCDAVAECGKDAKPAYKTCPLNTCCSAYGFCGITKDFCNTECQSNCVLDPGPPGVLTPGHVRQRVIGYYQSWSAGRICHDIKPHDLPISELTHLNHASAFVAPGTYEILPMDSTGSADQFQESVNAKLINPRLEVFVSIGGWSFPDDGTIAQSIFSDIASTASNQQKFADSVMRFMNKYGFDGLDIDWEYPAAHDRGGRPEDTQNFVSLLETLRYTFDAYPQRLGLTVAIPSSYWYLRWFDLPGIAQHVDWMNLMAYDLHGVWDRNNGIGNIVQAHSNLTEIKEGVELLWRAGVMPSQISLGFGLYGRSFELSDTLCTTPGCHFRGWGTAGPCSSASGILAHYEIQAILAEASDLELFHDAEAAVKYLVFGDNQWVSYDDADTFRQKLDWANTIGIGGFMIWAIDMDDDSYTAAAAFFNQTVAHPQIQSLPWSITPATVAQNIAGKNGQDCKIMPDCIDPRTDMPGSRCPDGHTKLGYDRSQCSGKEEGKIICCPTRSAPRSCMWRGNAPFCNGQCHPGEATVFRSSWGGGFKSETNEMRCTTGTKVFCCDAGDWKHVIQDCYWSECGQDCPSEEKTLTLTYHGCDRRNRGSTKKYCCPASSPLHDCQWRGRVQQCDDNSCLHDEVAIANDRKGDDPVGCAWFRQRTSCCKVARPPSRPLSCDLSTCQVDQELCEGDLNADLDGETYEHQDETISNVSLAISLEHVWRDEDYLSLERRGWRLFPWHLTKDLTVMVPSRSHPDAATNLRNLRQGLIGLARDWVQMRSQNCGRPGTGETEMDLDNPLAGSVANVEHVVPAFIVGRYFSSRVLGTLPNPVPALGDDQIPRGPPSIYPPISAELVQNSMLRKIMPVNLPPIGPNVRYLKKEVIQEPAQWLYERLGSTTNPENFIMVDTRINVVKGLLETFKRPMDPKKFNAYLKAGLEAGGDFAIAKKKGVVEMAHLEPDECIEAFFSGMRETISVFEYVNMDLTITRTDKILDGWWSDLGMIEQIIGQGHIQAPWPEYYSHYFSMVSSFARNWLTSRIQQVRQEMRVREQYDNGYFSAIESVLVDMENEVPKCYYPFEHNGQSPIWLKPG